MKFSTIFLLFSMCLGSLYAAEIEKPNVIIIFTDDQGYQDLGCFGSPLIQTPRIDQMAAEGIRMTGFYVSNPVCSASRASLLTGRRSNRHGIGGVVGPGGGGINNSEIMIPQLLKGIGYTTAMFGKWHLGDNTTADMPMAFGFDQYFGIPYSNDMKITSQQTFSPDCVFLEGYDLAQAQQDQANGGVQNKVPLIEGTQIIEYPADQATTTKRYFDRAIATIDTVTATDLDSPFFIYIAPAMPHVPLYASDEFEGTSARGLYGDVLEEIDYNVGRLLDHLKTKNVDERTMVIYTSDNGPWLNHGDATGDSDPYRGGKFNIWEGGIREPTVMWWPGKWQAGAVSHEIASTYDLMPTIGYYAGYALPSLRLDGINISHHLENVNVPVGRKTHIYNLGTSVKGIRKGNWKLLPNGGTGSGTPELFNIATDTYEQTNLYDSESDKVAELESDLAAFNATINVVDTTAPATPSGLNNSAAGGSVTIDWNDNAESDLMGYIIYRTTTSGSDYYPVGFTKEASSFTDNQPVYGVTNYYSVVAMDDFGNRSAYSTESSIAPTQGVLAPTGLVATTGQPLISLDWDDNTDVFWDSYTVYRSTTCGSGYSAIASGLIASEYLDQTAASDTSYYYVVKAVDTGVSESLPSNEAAGISTVMSDLTGNGKVCMEDVAVMSSDWQIIYGMSTLLKIADNWLDVAPLTFISDLLVKSDGFEGLEYSNTISSDVVDPYPYVLTFSKVNGPSWLSVSSNGDLSGTPLSADAASVNIFNVQAEDAYGNSAQAGLEIMVQTQGTPMEINIAGTAGSSGGEFADYSSLASGDVWGDSSVTDGAVSLTASRFSLNGDVSISKWNTNGYPGPGSEINFTKGGSITVDQALSGNAFVSLILESTSGPIQLDSISASMWRNGSLAADHYQLAYSTDSVWGTSDLLDTAMNVTTSGTSNTFTIDADFSSMETAGTQIEVRLYFWRPSGGANNANTHLYNVTAAFTR